MAKTSISNLDSQSSTLFADNTANGIEEGNLRTHHGDIHDSFVHLDESKYQRQAGDAGGSANAITVSIDYPAAYTANIPIRFKATATNTGAFTFKVNSLAALNVYDTTQAQITTAGAITSGLIYEVEWSTDADGGGTDGFILTRAGGSTASTGQFDTITDQAGSGKPTFTFGLTTDGRIVPAADNGEDIGSSSKKFKDGYFDGNLYVDALTDAAGTGAPDFTNGIINSGDIYSFRGTTASLSGSGGTENIFTPETESMWLVMIHEDG